MEKFVKKFNLSIMICDKNEIKIEKRTIDLVKIF